MRRTPLAVLICTLSLGGMVACGQRQPETRKASPIREAYSLLDQGQDAKAILLLQKIVQDEPANDEAHLLLASASLGQAGVDIYSAFDGFGDLVFSKSLSDRFFKSHRSESSPSPAATIQDPDAPMAGVVDRLDHALLSLQRVVAFLQRFPTVQKDHWPLLDQALSSLAGGTSRDVILYRVFVRVVYAKSLLDVRMVSNPEFLTRSWLCRLDLPAFDDDLSLLEQLFNASVDDLAIVFPDKPSLLSHFRTELTSAQSDLTLASDKTPGSDSGILQLQDSLRRELHCPLENLQAEGAL